MAFQKEKEVAQRLTISAGITFSGQAPTVQASGIAFNFFLYSGVGGLDAATQVRNP
jgi:hypothetical protein